MFLNHLPLRINLVLLLVETRVCFAVMIISASRRTDIPAFYAEWFMNRIRAGNCRVPNPYNKDQVSSLSLMPPDVKVIVFWTRHAGPMMKHLRELDERGFHYYFLYTLMANPRLLDPRTPSVEEALRTFCALADIVGPEKVIWRYDPVVLSTMTGVDFHVARFATIAKALKGRTRRVIISLVDVYKSITARLAALEAGGLQLLSPGGDAIETLARAFAEIAAVNGMEIVSCAEKPDLRPFGIKPGKCIDDEWIQRVFNISVPGRKDPAQREVCGCVTSRDIGMYDTCPFNCVYCYATRSPAAVEANRARHDPASPSLV